MKSLCLHINAIGRAAQATSSGSGLRFQCSLAPLSIRLSLPERVEATGVIAKSPSRHQQFLNTHASSTCRVGNCQILPPL